MHEHDRFTRFRGLHRQSRMQVVRDIERPSQTNGHGAAKKLQDSLHLPVKLPFWTRVRESVRRAFFGVAQPEILNVAGRTVSGLVVPYWAAGVVLAAVLSGFGFMYKSMDSRIDAKDEAYQAQRDMLIEIRTELRLSKEHDLEYRNEFKTTQKVQQLQIDQLNIMKALLNPQQQQTIERNIRRDN